MGWGTTFGRAWGGGAVSLFPFELLTARAVANNTVRVTFSKPPLLVSPLNNGDSSRLQNWTLVRTDKTQRITLLTVRPTEDPNSVEFIIAERWVSALAEYTITGADSLLAQDAQELILSPATANFLGVPSPIQVTERSEVLLDLLNPQDSEDFINAGFIVGTSGDYKTEAGLTLIKKLIIREVFTAQGEFLHLASLPYGLGVRAKGFFHNSDLASFQRRLQLNVLNKPEVRTARVRISLFPNGRGVISVKAQTDFGALTLEATVTTTGEVQF